MRSKLAEELLKETPSPTRERVEKDMKWLAQAEPNAAIYYGNGERIAVALRWTTYAEAVAYLKFSGWPCMKYNDPDGYTITWEKQQ